MIAGLFIYGSSVCQKPPLLSLLLAAHIIWMALTILGGACHAAIIIANPAALVATAAQQQ